FALGAGELDWGREQNRPDRGEPGGPRSDREHGPGTIGRLPVQEVVVDLHHDLVAGSKRDAVAVRKPAPAPAGCPRRDPVRIVQRGFDITSRAEPDAGSPETGPAEARTRRVEPLGFGCLGG